MEITKNLCNGKDPETSYEIIVEKLKSLENVQTKLDTMEIWNILDEVDNIMHHTKFKERF